MESILMLFLVQSALVWWIRSCNSMYNWSHFMYVNSHTAWKWRRWMMKNTVMQPCRNPCTEWRLETMSTGKLLWTCTVSSWAQIPLSQSARSVLMLKEETGYRLISERNVKFTWAAELCLPLRFRMFSYHLNKKKLIYARKFIFLFTGLC